LHPAQIPFAVPVESSGDPAELGQEGVPPLDGAPDAPDARPAGLAAGRGQPAEPGLPCPVPARPVPVPAVAADAGPVAGVGGRVRPVRRGRVDDPRVEHVLRPDAVVRVRAGDRRGQDDAVPIGRSVHGGAALAAIDGAGAGGGAPFSDGVFAPSIRTWSQFTPRSASDRSADRRHASRKASAARHTARRRRMVRPDGQQGGTYSQPMPVTRTYSRPCRQAWLRAGGRPSPSHATGGRTGSKADQTSSGRRRAIVCRRMAATPLDDLVVAVLSASSKSARHRLRAGYEPPSPLQFSGIPQ